MNCNRNNCGCASRGQHIRINPVHEHQHERRAVLLPARSSAASAAEDAAAITTLRASRSIMAACAALSVILNAAWPDAWA